MEVRLAGGGLRRCFTYVAMAGFVDERLAPFTWYRELVELGARYHGFPADYIARLARHPARPDPDARRGEEEESRAARLRRPPRR